MQYPLISEYVRAMQDPAGNLDQLAHLVPVLDEHGEPMRSSGAFAVPPPAVGRGIFATQIFFHHTKKGQAPKRPPLSISYHAQISRYPEPS